VAGRLLIALALACLVLVVATPGPARAATPNAYQVTFVARSCPAYTDITANLARNNIQESLEDLGADTAYVPGQAISPSIEAPNQPNCTPLDGWQFTFGSGIAGKVSHLSTVTSPGAPITVQPSVALLDPQGNPTGQSIDGATTVTLTSAQVSAAMSHNLWVQGGTATDPLVTGTFDNRYAFGALRCAIDNLNGDNVEWVGFPSGVSHVFCYYYAVDQEPLAGTIIVKKQLGAGEEGTQTFQFQGNISYDAPDGDFAIPVSGAAPSSGSISFVRAADTAEPWSFHELAYPGFTLTALSCVSAGGHTGSYTTDLGTGTSTVTLVPGDTVTCTYTDSLTATNAITVVKQTDGGYGGPFHFTVTPPSGPATDLSATTTATDPVAVAGTVSDTVSGQGPFTYGIAETVPTATGAGSWSVSGFGCTGGTVGQAAPTDPDQTVTVTSGESIECTFTNTFHPTGGLTITKTTTGGTGTTDFVVTAVPGTGGSDPTDTGDLVDPLLSATTVTPGVAVTATQTGGDPVDALDLGRYSIVEEGPEDSTAGTWAPAGITCNGATSDPSAADVLVTLTASEPHVTCAFINAFTPVTPTPTTTTTVAPATTVPTKPATQASSTGPGLAATGTDVRLPLGLAAVLALAGVTLLAVDRLRRSRRPAPGPAPDDHPT
jgi:hypothetical protein